MQMRNETISQHPSATIVVSTPAFGFPGSCHLPASCWRFCRDAVALDLRTFAPKRCRTWSLGGAGGARFGSVDGRPLMIFHSPTIKRFYNPYP